jgi:hypothetical protein
MKTNAVKPWYREPWPWLLMLGPAIVVVAGLNMMVVAFRGADGLVADDYYKQGLGINRVIERDARAAALHVGATLQVNEETGRVRLLLAGGADAESLRLALRHPTRAQADQSIALARVAPGVYQGVFRGAGNVAWHVQLEDAAGRWRLTGRWRAPAEATVVLGGRG